MDNIYKEITQQDKKILSFVDHTKLVDLRHMATNKKMLWRRGGGIWHSFGCIRPLL